MQSLDLAGLADHVHDAEVGEIAHREVSDSGQRFVLERGREHRPDLREELLLVLEALAFGDVGEDHRDQARRRTRGGDLEVAAERLAELLDARRPSAHRHLAVSVEPVRFGLREDLAHRLADDLVCLDAEDALERRVHLFISEVVRRALGVEHGAVQRVAVTHVLEQRAKARLALLQRSLDALALGDVADEREAVSGRQQARAHLDRE